METKIEKGIYRHYKGGIYEVTDFAEHSETGEKLVIYKNVFDGRCWARPAEMWNEEVKLPNGTVKRFTYLARNLEGGNYKK
jgi:hypothetical protein